MNQTSNAHRILAVSLSSPGFGYAVLEGEKGLIHFGNRVFDEDKNVRSLAGIEKLIVRNMPDVLVLQDVNAKGTHRAARIKELHHKVVTLGKKNTVNVVTISPKALRAALLGNERGTKHEMAELVAKRFPDELARRLPSKRRTWDSQDRRMDIFDAVALGVVSKVS